MRKTRKYRKKFGGTPAAEAAAEAAAAALLAEEEREKAAKKAQQAKKSAKKARQRDKKEEIAARQRDKKDAEEKALAELERVHAEWAEREAAEIQNVRQEAAAREQEEQRIEELKGCCEARDKVMAKNSQLQDELDACNEALADAKQKISASDTRVSEAASSSSSAQDRKLEGSWETVTKKSEGKPAASKDKRQSQSKSQSQRQSQRQQLSKTQQNQAAEKNDLLKIIKIAIEKELKRNNILTPEAIKGNKTMGFIEFSPNILNFPDTGNTGGHITIMPNNETNENGSHITITLLAPWTPGTRQGGTLHIYRNGSFNVKWQHHYGGEYGPQAARPLPDNLSILNSKNWEEIYSKLVTVENGLPLHVRGIALGAAGGPKSINFGVNCAQCGELQEGDVNNVNSSRTKDQFIKMMQTLREFMIAVNKILNDKQNIQDILSQKGGKKTRKHRKQRKQKTKGKKSKERKSKRVKRKTHKYR